jgi:hypothetical protein
VKRTIFYAIVFAVAFLVTLPLWHLIWCWFLYGWR